MRIAVTGANGQIGHELVHALAPLGEVCPLSRTQLDLASPDSIRSALRQLRPNLIVNAGGYTAVDAAENDGKTAEIVNAAAPGILAEEAARLHAGIVHYSTDYVFDGASTTPYTPDDQPNPQSVYGRTKLDGERAVLAAAAPALILRTSWVYAMRGRNFVMAILRQAQSGRPLRVVSDQIGSPTWAREVALATAGILRHSLHHAAGSTDFSGREGLYHLTASGRTNWFDFARRIVDHAQIVPSPAISPVSTVDYGVAAHRPAFSVLCCDKTEQTFNVRLGDWGEAFDRAFASQRQGDALASSGSNKDHP